MSTPLEALQRTMLAAIAGEGNALTAAAQVLPSATLTARERLAIYQRSYLARLVECMESMFPALLFALGQPLFRQFALDYLRRHPPRSYTLARLADDFPAHLEDTRPKLEEWPLFLTHLATWELALLQVADGPGLEGMPPAGAVPALSDAEFLALRPAPAVCRRLHAFHYPVHHYRAAVHGGEKPELPLPRRCHLAITRHNYRVMTYELESAEFALLMEFDGQQSVGDALARLSLTPPLDAARQWVGDAYRKALLVAR